MNQIKTIGLALICMSFSSLPLHAQKCHFRVDKQDPITNEHVRSILLRVGGLNSQWNINFEQKGPKYSITLHIVKEGKISEIAPAGTKILCKLENGKLVEIPTSQEIIPVYTNAGGTVQTEWNLVADVSKDMLTQLSASEITLFRVNIGGKDYDHDLGGKNAGKILEAAGCLLTE